MPGNLTRNVYTAGRAVPAVETYSAAQATAIATVPPNSFGFAYGVGTLYLFFLFSHATEFIDSSGRLHIMILLAVLCGIATLSAGTLPDCFKSKPGVALTLFTMFMIVGIPFSTWKGGSFKNFMDLWWKSYATFFLVSGLVFTLQQMRRSLFIIAGATAGILYFAHKSLRTYEDGRVSTEFGSLGNSNDLAGALLVCLPFVMYVMVDKKRSAAIRIVCLAMSGFLLATVVKTGSRASLLVVGLMAVLLFLRASGANRAKLLACCAVLVCVFPFFVSKDLMIRYKTTFTSDVTEGITDTAASAIESTQARKQLIRNAAYLTFRHPIFGVGLGNFAFSSADLELAKGNPPLWYTCHDIYLLVSSETGVAGFIFFLCTLVFTGKILRRVEKTSKNVPELEGVPQMAYCILMALIVYASCGVFNTNAYSMQLPSLAGLAVALDRVTRTQLAKAEERRMEQFRASIPVHPSKFAGVSATSLAYR